MATNINDLWVTASMDADVELKDRLVLEARLEAAEYWPILAAAGSPQDFKNRLALIDDQVSSIALKVTDGIEAKYAYSVVRMELENALAEDFQTVHEARKVKEAARIAKNKAHAAKLQLEVLAELSKEAEGQDWKYDDGIGNVQDSARRPPRPEEGASLGKADAEAGHNKYMQIQENDGTLRHDPEWYDAYSKAYDEAKTGSRKHADGPTTADPNFLAAPAEGQGTPPSTEGTPGSNAGDDSSADGEELDESKGPNVIDDSVIVNGKRIARFQTEGANFTRQHFNTVAEGIRTAPVDEETREILARHFADHLSDTNANFNRDRFVGASTNAAHTGSRKTGERIYIDTQSGTWGSAGDVLDGIRIVDNATDEEMDELDQMTDSEINDFGRRRGHTASRHPLVRTARDGDYHAGVVTSNTPKATVERYLPENYSCSEAGPDKEVVVSGKDKAGWTWHDYVLPRCASGLITIREFSQFDPAPQSQYETDLNRREVFANAEGEIDPYSEDTDSWRKKVKDKYDEWVENSGENHGSDTPLGLGNFARKSENSGT